MIATGHKTKDPVCGMDVDEKSAAGTIQHLGQSYSFCSQRCLEKFRADPSNFVEPDASTLSAIKAESVAHASPAAKVEYVCPMHPQIVRSEPGSCPICGMALEPRTITAEEKDNPELRDMTRRFWISLGLTIPVLLAAMSEFIPGNPLHQLAPARFWTWFELILASPVVLMGRLAVLRSWLAVDREPESKYVHADRVGRGRGLCVQRGCSSVSRHLPRLVPR